MNSLSRPASDSPATNPRTRGVPWWRPATKWGRIFLAVGFLTVAGILATAGYIFKTYLERDPAISHRG